jgi:polyisoprenyl-phosphate glycosyltransferase
LQFTRPGSYKAENPLLKRRKIVKKIEIVSPCFNEVENVRDLYEKTRKVMQAQAEFDYDILFIDNSSTDGTVEVLRELAREDTHVKVILNARNFGHIRSPYYGLLQCHADAAIIIASDLQDPPDLIPQFIQKWKDGYKVVMGVKVRSEETPIFYALRTLYYRTLQALSETRLEEHATGFGLYDQEVIATLRLLQDPYPYFRGLLSELGYARTTIAYNQPKRVRGLTKNNFYTLYDMAMLGLTNHSRLPLRLAAIIGFIASFVSFLTGIVYLIYKLIYWQNFTLGLAPVVVGLFFMGSIQLFFLGIVGEYIGAIYTQVLKRPLVIEKERINLEK